MADNKRKFYEFFCPVKILSGKNALENIPFELELLGAKAPLIITDKGIIDAGIIQHLEAVFTEEIKPVGIFDQVIQDSSYDSVAKAANVYREKGADSIIAVGGGSVIDSAKAINILVSLGGDDLSVYAGAHALKQRLNPLFVLPTTCGTGSEVTNVAVVADRTGVKQEFLSHFLLPDLAVLDPRLTLKLPLKITAMTGMDALTHSIEAYTGVAANPMSSAYAISAIKKIVTNLPKVMEDSTNIEWRLEMSEAATMAGIAFSNSMVGLVHAMGHSLGSVCGIPHGICMNLFLPYVLEYNLDVRREELSQLLLFLAGDEVFASTPKEKRAEASIEFIRKMRDDLFAKVGLPRTLKETGKVTKEDLDKVAELTQNDGSILYNPKEADLAQIKKILELAWE